MTSKSVVFAEPVRTAIGTFGGIEESRRKVGFLMPWLRSGG